MNLTDNGLGQIDFLVKPLVKVLDPERLKDFHKSLQLEKKEGEQRTEQKKCDYCWRISLCMKPQDCFIVLWQKNRMMDEGVTFPKSRTSKRSKASNKSLFFIPNTSQQDVRNLRMFFKHRNCNGQKWTLINFISLSPFTTGLTDIGAFFHFLEPCWRRNGIT